MALFQTSVLKSHLEQLDETSVDKAYKKFQKYFWNTTIQTNIRTANEEQYQATFLHELFVNILGYTLFPNPNSNLTTEFKNQTNARKADGAILKEGNALAVIELKGMNTKDLESIRKQAFDYKNYQTGCVYIITSNFEKLRFYINDATEFEEFDLFTLSRKRFNLLYLCLHKDKLLQNAPLKIKQASIVEEEEITKAFYKDYSVFKRELYRDLVKRNSKTVKSKLASSGSNSHAEPVEAEIDTNEDLQRLEKNVKLTLFKKSQKLIDRFLFLFFAEDRSLLPSNFTNTIITDWKKLVDMHVDVTLYERFKLNFNFLDQGRAGKEGHDEIHAYNGGLFKPDSILDALEIDSELLQKHALKLSKYDFESQVDVNILGHIFENSLNEIESVNAEIEGGEFDKQTSKRKKDGVFYTPKYITKYIVDNTVGKLCEEKKRELKITDERFANAKARSKKGISDLETYRNWLLELTICDPACGSGAFLNQALEFLIREHNYLDELSAKYHGGFAFPDIENTILENNIYGVDLNEESVEIAKLSLWLRTAQPRRKLNDLSSNIKCGNSLIDSKAVAGDKAFKWETAFAKVFSRGGFDVVIGNPPYVRKQGLVEHYPEMCNYYERKYQSATANYDIYALFMERCYQLINLNGIVSFILPHKFLISDFGIGIRTFFKENTAVEKLIHFGSEIIFSEASTYTCIIDLTRGEKDRIKFKKLKPDDLFQPFEWDTMRYSDLSQSNWDLQSEQVFRVIDKLNEQPFKAEDVFDNIFQGIATSLDAVYTFKGINKGDVIEGYNTKYDYNFTIEKELVMPFVKGNQLSKYSNPEVTDYVFFPYQLNGNEALPVEEDYLKSDLPLTYSYLKHFEKEIRGRERGRMDIDVGWYLYIYPKSLTKFQAPKIMTQEISFGCNMTYDENGEFYHPTTVYSFVKNDKFDVDEKFYLGILNSRVMWFFIRNTGTELRGGYFRFKTNYIKPFPLPEISVNSNLLVDKVKAQLGMVKLFQNIERRFENYLISLFKFERLSKKLQSWHELEFAEFLKELNKAIKATNKIRSKENQPEIPALTKLDEMDWMEAFEVKKKEAQELQTQIQQTEKHIDQMVYKLYGLTEDEIAIVENS